METPEPETEDLRQWRRVFAIVTGFLLLFVAALALWLYRPSDPARPWRQELQSFADEGPQDNGLSALVDALRRTQWSSLRKHHDALRAVALEGRVVEPDIASLLAAHGPVISSVTRSVSQSRFELPPTLERAASMPRPDFASMEEFGFLLVANARALAASGQPDEAVQRLVEVMTLGARLQAPYESSTLLCHLSGLALQEVALVALEEVVRRSTLSTETRAKLLAQITQVARIRTPMREGLRAEATMFVNDVTAVGEDPDGLAEVLQSYDTSLLHTDAKNLAKDLGPDTLTLLQEHDRIWRDLSLVMAKPFPDQPSIDAAWFAAHSTNKLLLRSVQDSRRLLVRECVFAARMQLLRARLLLSLGATKEAQALADPFSHEAIAMNETLLWSVGPDRHDDDGQIAYDPAKGPESPGDIISRIK